MVGVYYDHITTCTYARGSRYDKQGVRVRESRGGAFSGGNKKSSNEHSFNVISASDVKLRSPCKMVSRIRRTLDNDLRERLKERLTRVYRGLESNKSISTNLPTR